MFIQQAQILLQLYFIQKRREIPVIPVKPVMLKNAARRISYEIRTCSWPPAPQQIIEDTDDPKVNQYNFLALIVSPYSS